VQDVHQSLPVIKHPEGNRMEKMRKKHRKQNDTSEDK